MTLQSYTEQKIKEFDEYFSRYIKPEHEDYFLVTEFRKFLTTAIEQAHKFGFDEGEKSCARAILRRKDFYSGRPDMNLNHILLMCASLQDEPK